MDSKNRSAAGIGMPTVLTVILVLLMSVIAVSSLALAKSDRTLTARSEDATKATYDAYAAAERAWDTFQDGDAASYENTWPITSFTRLRAVFSRDKNGPHIDLCEVEYIEQP